MFSVNSLHSMIVRLSSMLPKPTLKHTGKQNQISGQMRPFTALAVCVNEGTGGWCKADVRLACLHQ